MIKPDPIIIFSGFFFSSKVNHSFFPLAFQQSQLKKKLDIVFDALKSRLVTIIHIAKL